MSYQQQYDNTYQHEYNGQQQPNYGENAYQYNYQPSPAAPLTASYSSSTENKKDEDNAMLLFVLAFFIGGIVLWLINYFLYKNSPNPNAQKWAKYSLYAAIFIGGFSFLCFGVGMLIIILSSVIH